MPDVSSLRAALLDWYDAHARTLPWRAPPGARTRTEPYRVWLSEVMLQQTTVPHAAPYFERFTTRWPTVSDLAAVEDADLMAAWAGLGYYARARNLLACARAVASEHGGVFPDTEAALLALPGVGAYTAAAVAANKHVLACARLGLQAVRASEHSGHWSLDGGARFGCLRHQRHVIAAQPPVKQLSTAVRRGLRKLSLSGSTWTGGTSACIPFPPWPLQGSSVD